MDITKVKALADGRVYTGQQAQAVGLVDELGNYYDALEAAGKAIGVDGIPEIKENKRQKPWEVFFSAQLSKMIAGAVGNATAKRRGWNVFTAGGEVMPYEA